MANKSTDRSWAAATWQGSRDVQLRAALAMTLRQRFQALEALTELAQRLATMPDTRKRIAKKRPSTAR